MDDETPDERLSPLLEGELNAILHSEFLEIGNLPAFRTTEKCLRVLVDIYTKPGVTRRDGNFRSVDTIKSFYNHAKVFAGEQNYPTLEQFVQACLDIDKEK